MQLVFYSFENRFQGKISLRKYSMIPAFNKISAILKIGNQDHTNIKSLTQPKNILSNKFHNVPAIKRAAIIQEKYF